MKRRDFIKRGAVAAGLAGSLKFLPSLIASEGNPARSSGQAEILPEAKLSDDYISRVQQDNFLPKPPQVADSSAPDDVKISPMPLAERVRRKIVPQRGFCSLSPD